MKMMRYRPMRLRCRPFQSFPLRGFTSPRKGSSRISRRWARISSWRELVRRLRELGFEAPFEGGKHPYMIRGEIVVTIPNPHRCDISVDLLERILRRTGIGREEWRG